ncbi:MAG: DUF1329 domain-containing protein [Bdellovibrionales bacterium]|nr:DUF1329 domain-containing protein [Bdellovibrionales bacterium]
MLAACRFFFVIFVSFLSLPVHGDDLREVTLVNTKETEQADPVSLPDISVSGAHPLRIDEVNLPSYSSLLLNELIPLVESGEFAFSAAKELPFHWRVDDDWLRTTMNESALRFDGEGVLQQSGLVARGYPFRLSDEQEQDASPSLFAKKVLYNTAAHYWANGTLVTEFTLLTFSESKLESEYPGSIRRVYPARFSEKFSQQLFREIVDLRLSPTFSPLRWLTFRFFSDQEELVWANSPALQKVRRITGVNRSDALYGSNASLDDIFTWSGALRDVDAVYEKKQTLFVPFRHKDQLPLVRTQEGCDVVGDDNVSQRRELLGRPLEWNFESRKYLGAAPWVPSYVIFYPREMFRITLQSQNPYQPYARQVIYVDSEMQLPVYKVVYDNQGQLWKIVFSVYSQASTSDRKTKMTVPDFTVVLDRKAQTSSIYDFSSFALCIPGDEQEMLAAYGPTKLIDVKEDLESSEETKKEAAGKDPAEKSLDPL